MDQPVLLKSNTLARGENARVEVHRSLDGGCKLVLKDSKHPQGYTVGLDPRSTVGIAMAMFEAVGIPIQAELAKRMQQQTGGAS